MSNNVDNGGINGLWCLSLVQCLVPGRALLMKAAIVISLLSQPWSHTPRVFGLTESPCLVIPGMHEKAQVGRPGSCHVPATRLSV